MVEWNTGMTFDTSKSIVAHLWWLVKVVLENLLRLKFSSMTLANLQSQERGVRGVCPPPPPLATCKLTANS